MSNEEIQEATSLINNFNEQYAKIKAKYGDKVKILNFENDQHITKTGVYVGMSINTGK